MVKQSSIKNKNGGIMARVGAKFYQEIEKIKDERLKNGLSRERLATAKITNLITRHNLWNDIKKDIINVEEQELLKNG